MLIIATIIVLIEFLILFIKQQYKRKQELRKQYKRFTSARECLAYFGVEVPKGYVVLHKNRNKRDNFFNNLEVMSRKEMLYRIVHEKSN